MNLVHTYTTRGLSYKSDRLHAISAIAREVQLWLGDSDEYMLGLWKRYLYLHLLWHLETKHQLYNRAEQPNGQRPTWSWISTDGTVYNHRTNREAMENCIPIVELSPHIVYQNEQDSFGDSVIAELGVKGHLAKVILLVLMTDEPLKNLAYIWLPGGKDEEPQKLTPRLADLDFIMRNRDFEKPVHALAFCLFVIWEHRPASTVRELVGLILERWSGTTGRFRRIGMFTVEQPECEDLLKRLAAKYPLEEGEYLERHADGTYSICLL